MAGLPRCQVAFCRGLHLGYALKYCKTFDFAGGAPVRPSAMPGGWGVPAGFFLGCHTLRPGLNATHACVTGASSSRHHTPQTKGRVNVVLLVPRRSKNAEALVIRYRASVGRLKVLQRDEGNSRTHSTVALPSFPRVTLPSVLPSRMSLRFCCVSSPVHGYCSLTLKNPRASISVAKWSGVSSICGHVHPA